MLNPTKFVSDCLEKKYKRPTITVMEGCCRKCHRGTPAVLNLKKNPINSLLEEGIIDPYQTINAFHLGSAYETPYFKNPVMNMNSKEIPCKYPGNCNLTCVICSSLIVNSDDVELDIWPGFKVHKACTALCLHPCCRKRLPTIPAYASPQRSSLMCDLHKDSNAFQKLSISALAPTSSTKAETVRKPIYPPPRPISLPQPQADPKKKTVAFDIPVKRTFSFKNIPKHQPKAKADKFDEKGRSVDILSFFSPPGQSRVAQAKIQEAALKASKREDAPRRFIRNKETGMIFGYWMGDQAYRIDTDPPELLFTESKAQYSSNIKFDFTPPVSSVRDS
jgi:hypothetical protein